MTDKDKIFEQFITNTRQARNIKLVGQCKNCGKCCNPVTSYEINTTKQTMDICNIADSGCMYLDPVTNKCTSYKDRGILCSMFPYLPENIIEGCGYHFEKIDPKPLTIGVVMIVKNEKSCLEQCLNSIQGVDEIIIVDTGSSDNTCEIARKYTAKVFENEYKWEDSFCKARNYALSKSTTDWVLSIDADEFLEKDGIQKIRKAIEFAEVHNQKTINCIMVANIVNDEFYFPRLFKRCPEVYWKGDIHNYLSISEQNKCEIRITYKYSEAHKNDPDRALRILTKVMIEHPESVREAFYLAREYWYRQDWNNAISWYKNYLSKASWPPEWAEAWLMLAKCYSAVGNNDEAKNACLQAIKINADFQEALEYMASICGPKNKAKWLLYAQFANSNDVFTVRKKVEQRSDYYNKLFANDSDMSRYHNLYEKIGQLVGDDNVLDIGCGTADIQKFIKHYHGFDFSEKAVKIANNPNVWVGDIYDGKNYGNYDTYVSTEALEHLDDMNVLANIPHAKRVIVSVPSFDDTSHLRVYTEEIVHVRWGGLLDIKNIYRFNWKNGWQINNEPTDSYILLIDAVKK
jgi:glycosyltransferase involved in cell wall biosynthesis